MEYALKMTVSICIDKEDDIIDMEYDLKMTVSIWEMTVSIWDILSIFSRPCLAGDEVRLQLWHQAGRCRLTVKEPVLKAPMVSALVGRCRLPVSNPVLKAPMVSALVRLCRLTVSKPVLKAPTVSALEVKIS